MSPNSPSSYNPENALQFYLITKFWTTSLTWNAAIFLMQERWRLKLRSTLETCFSYHSHETHNSHSLPITVVAMQRCNKSSIIFRELKSYNKPLKHIKSSAGHTKFNKKLSFYFKCGKNLLLNARHRHFLIHSAFLRRQRRRLVYRRPEYKCRVFPCKHWHYVCKNRHYFKLWATTARSAAVFQQVRE